MSSKKIILTIMMYSMMIGSVAIAQEYVYQENANATYTDAYVQNPTYCYDGDYDTECSISAFEVGNYYANYTIPSYSAGNGSLIQVKYGNNPPNNITSNYTISQDCYGSILQLKFQMEDNDYMGGGTRTRIYCWNGSVWELSNSLSSYGGGGEGIYEEAMFWLLPTTTTTTTTTIGEFEGAMTDIGAGIGSLLVQLGSPFMVFMVAMSLAMAIGYVFSSIGRRVGANI